MISSSTRLFPDVAYPEDGYRLVQAWARYTLSEGSQYSGHLFSSTTNQISSIDQTCADHTAALPAVPLEEGLHKIGLHSGLFDGESAGDGMVYPGNTADYPIALTNPNEPKK